MSAVSHALVVISSTAHPLPLAPVRALLEAHSVRVVDTRRLPVPRSLAGRRAVVLLSLAGVADPDGLRVRLDALTASFPGDLVLQSMAVRLADYRLAVFDMDSTLIGCEVIDELARRAGVGDAVAAITERAMGGELDFRSSFTQRLAMLQGLPEAALASVARDLPVTEGVPEMMATLRGLGIRTAILSGGFRYFAEHLQSRFGFDAVYANDLEIDGGIVTGRVVGEIVDGDVKRRRLEELVAAMAIAPAQTIAVGDGANDLPMLFRAGLGVAFRAKPVVRKAAAHNLQLAGLDGLLYLLGAPSEAAGADP